MGRNHVCESFEQGPFGPKARRSWLLLLLPLVVLACSKPDPQRRPNVVLVVMDTTRADHLSLYGYDRNTTPYLASLAEESIRFDRAYATSPWTVSLNQ